MNRITKLSLLGFLACLAYGMAASDLTVGREGTIEFTWAGEQLRTVDQPIESPFHCDIASTRNSEKGTIYVLNYTLLEHGKHNLNTALLSMQGRPVDGLPDIWVSAPTLLPDHFKGNLLDYSLRPVTGLKGFSTRMFAFAGLWVLMGAGGLYMLRRRQPVVAEETHDQGPTVAAILKPLVMKAAEDSLSVEEKVELNRILFRFWQVKLGLTDTDPVTSLEHLRNHTEAGELLGYLDRWLFSPDPVSGKDLDPVLTPYSGTLASELYVEDLK